MLGGLVISWRIFSKVKFLSRYIILTTIVAIIEMTMFYPELPSFTKPPNLNLTIAIILPGVAWSLLIYLLVILGRAMDKKIKRDALKKVDVG